MDWQSFLQGSENLPVYGLMLRAVVIYFALIVSIRFMGHRQVGILSGHDFLIAAGIVSLATVRMINPESSLTSGLVIILVYSGVNKFLSYLDIKWPKIIDRKPKTLMKSGTIVKENLVRCNVTIDNLLGQLRLKGIHNLTEVDTVVLEPCGKLSIVKKPEHMPLIRKQMKLPPKQTALPVVLIYDGQVERMNLQKLGLEMEWLIRNLGEKGISNSKDVFLALLEADGNIYVSV